SYPDDVWVLLRATGSGGAPIWIALGPGAGPMGRQQAATGYDPTTNRLIIHGGCTGACDSALADTWVLTNANGTEGTPEWIRLPDAPMARAGAAYAYDRAGNRLLVFGGAEGGAGSERNDVWVLQDANGIGTPAWQELSPEGPGPSPRSSASGAYDEATHRFMIFGGRQANDQVSNEVWLLSDSDSANGTSEWTRLEPSGAPPAPRWGHAGFYDEAARRLLVFGGSSAGLESGLNFVANDLWMLTDLDGGSSTSEWIRLTPERGPPLGRLLATAAYSPSENSIVIHSGKNNRASLPDDLVGDHWVVSNAVGSLPLVSEDQIETTYDTITPGASDTYFWRVVSRDDHGARAGSPAFRFRPNAAPTVDAGPDQIVHLPGVGEGTANLVGSVSDDDLPVGRILTFQWTLVSGPDGLVIEDPDAISTVITIQEAGTYVLRLTASDSELEGSDEVMITFVRNAAPVVSAGPDRVIEQPTDTVLLDGTVTDDGLPPGSVLSIEWSRVDGPGDVTFSSPQSEDTNATFSALGLYTLRLTASDSDFTIGDDVQVAFTPRNQPPLVDAGPDRVVSPNLIRNPGAEDPLVGGNIPQWTEVRGTSWTRRLNNDPFEGEAHFFAGTAPGEVELAQDIDISALAAAVDGGTQRLQFIGYVRTFDPDTARIVVEYRDAANTTVLDTFDSGPINSHQVWLRLTDPRLSPPGTRFVRVRLISNRLSGSSNDGYFDALSLYPFTDAFQATTTLAGAVQDDGLPFGAPLTTAWTQTSGPNAATLTDPTSPQSGVFFTDPGDHVFELVASDTEFTAADSVSLSVQATNLAPAVDAGPDQSFVLESSPIGLNLLANPGNELPLVHGEIFGWDEVQGTEWTQRSESPDPHAGDHYFYAGNVSLGELKQDVDVRVLRASIDAGAQEFRFNGYVRSFPTGAADTARVVLEYRDEDNTDVLDVFDSGPIGSQGAWQRVTDSRVAPVGTGFIRVRLIARRQSGASNDGYFDSLHLYAPSGTEVDLDGLVFDDGLPAGAALSSSWTLVSGPDAVAFEDASIPVSKVTLGVEGEYVLRLTATDTELVNHDDVTIALRPSNRAPQVDAGPDQLLSSTGQVALLQGFVVDDGLPEGSVLTTVWVVTGGPGDVVFSSAGTFDTEATFSAAGRYVLRLMADDGELSGFDELVVTVDGPNQPPVVDVGPGQTLDGLSTMLEGSAADDGLPIGSVLVTTWSQLSGPGTALFDNRFSPTTSVSFDALGEYHLQLQASDSLLTAVDEVVIDVAPAVAPPDLTVGAIDVSGATFDAQSLALGGSLSLELVNIGLGDVMDSFDVAIFEDRNANGSFEAAVDNPVGAVTHEGGLAAGDSAMHIAEVSGVLEFFASPIHFFVDRADAIAESREDNNVGSTEPACNFVPPVFGAFTPVEDWTWDSSEVFPNR
ncbi:MAG: PKD domain-containing protein, partial [Vicinamibacteria bacterium]